MVQILPAGETESGLIASLSRQTFMEAFAADNTEANMALFMATQFSAEMLEAETRLPGLHFFIAWLEGKPVGYLKLKTHGNGHINIQSGKPTLEICRIYVIQDCIGQGLGQIMMDYTLRFARENELQLVCLGVWENNVRAIRFYQKNGFEKVGEHSFLLGSDNQTDWLMARKT